MFGNHDCSRHMSFDDMKSSLPNATHIPAFEAVNILGLRFLFAPWISDPAFDFVRAMGWLKNQKNIHVLCTHTPGHGVLDSTTKGLKVGSIELKSALIRIKPMCHLFGHVHEEYGYCMSGKLKILSVNSSLCNCPPAPRKIINAGHVVTFIIKNDDTVRLLGVESNILFV